VALYHCPGDFDFSTPEALTEALEVSVLSPGDVCYRITIVHTGLLGTLVYLDSAVGRSTAPFLCVCLYANPTDPASPYAAIRGCHEHVPSVGVLDERAALLPPWVSGGNPSARIPPEGGQTKLSHGLACCVRLHFRWPGSHYCRLCGRAFRVTVARSSSGRHGCDAAAGKGACSLGTARYGGCEWGNGWSTPEVRAT
jgi:hypothetical protein